jgi:very-short-patch-repair endonuclease
MIEIREKINELGWQTDPELWEQLKPLARQMRKEPTETEEMLWRHLRKHQLSGFKFRRQHSIERFIVDFYCAERKLALEVDGPIHQYTKSEYLIRLDFLESSGVHVLRFSNDAILNNIKDVLIHISEALTSPPIPLSVYGEGELKGVRPKERRL